LRRTVQLVLAVALVATCATAGAADLAILRNGNSIRHERRQIAGAITRLYLSDSSSGYIEIPTDQIERFERDTAPPPAPSSTSIASAGAKPAPAPTQAASVVLNRQDLNNVVNGAGERHQIDPDFINSVIRAESGFHQNAVSRKGAQGLMQLMPGTASQMGVANPFDPNANVEGGTKYLRELLEKYNFDVPKALAAYNAGPKRVDQYRGVPPYYETQAYIARIIRDFNRKKLADNPALARKANAAAGRSSQTSTAAGKRRKVTGPSSVPKGPESASK
jgi:soluble lytic murein transglycosylase-like protein